MRVSKLQQALLALLLCHHAMADTTLPSGGTVVRGGATIEQSGNTQTVTQTTGKAIINWQDFSIGKDGTVNFVQPNSSSVVLNRVIGGNSSEIYGRLTANGQVFIVNPNGIYFGSGSSVDVGGLLATTLAIGNDDFMNSNYVFARDSLSTARRDVINDGVLKARDNGYVVLAGDYAANRGIVQAKLGTVALASGSKMTLDVQGDNLINFAVNEKTVASLFGVDNSGQLLADGGRAIMTAAVATDLQTAVVNNSGIIRANTSEERNGEIILSAVGGNTQNSGTLDASGTGAGQTGGAIKVLGNKVALTDNAVLDASGNAGGGKINIGGNYQGAGPLANAQTTYVGKNVKIKADALRNGNGGNVVVWSNDWTRFYGSISAQGGAQSGNGGTVEVSGKQTLDYNGFTNTLANYGKTGTLLLDPTDILIGNGTQAGDITANGGVFEGGSADTSRLSVGALETALTSSDVIIKTTSSGNAPNGGTITIDDAGGGGVQWAGNKLTLQADNNIVINSAVQASGTGSITFNAVNNVTTIATVSTGAGPILVTGNNIITNATVSTGGGALTLDSGNSVTVNSTVSSNGGAIVLDGNSLTLNGNVNAGSGRLLLNANGATQTTNGSIKGNSLLITGSGTWNLEGNGDNRFNTLAANVADGTTIRYKNNQNLSVGTVLARDGVTNVSGITNVNGDTQVNTQGALSLANSITTGKGYFNSTGGITQATNANITANQLLLTGGAVNLTNTGNNVKTIAANINGQFKYIDNDGTLEVGAAYGTNGITTNNNDVTIQTGDAPGFDKTKQPDYTSTPNNPASLVLNESINAGNATVRITTGDGGVYQRHDVTGPKGSEVAVPNGSITANNLLLQSSDTSKVTPFVLINAMNRVNTIAAKVNGSVSFAGAGNSGSNTVTVGTIDGISGITTTSNKIVSTSTDTDLDGNTVTTNITNDNNVSLSIGGNLNIDQNINANAATGTNSVSIGIGGDFTARTGTNARINADTLALSGKDMQGTFNITSKVSNLVAAGGKLMVIDNTAQTGTLTGLSIGASSSSTTVTNNGTSTTVASDNQPVGDFYLTTGGALNIIKLNSKGKNLMLRSTSLSILLDAVTADNARIMLQPLNLNSSIGIANGTEPGFNPGYSVDADTLLKFTNPVSTFYFGTPQKAILNDSTVSSAAKNTFTGNVHIGYEGDFNLGYRSLSAETSGNMTAYNVGPLYNLSLAAPNLTINGFKTIGNQMQFFSNNLSLPSAASAYVNANKPTITLRSLNDQTIWLGHSYVNNEVQILPSTLVKLPDGSTIVVGGSTDYPFPNGGSGYGDIHATWDDGIVLLGNRKLILSTNHKIFEYNATPLHTNDNTGKAGGLWQGCQNLTNCVGSNPSPYPDPGTGTGGGGGGGGGGDPDPSEDPGPSCKDCPSAPPNTNPYPPDTTGVDPGTGDPNPGGNPNPGTKPTDGLPGDGTPTDGNSGDGIPTDGFPNDGLPGDDGGLPGGGNPGDGTPTDGNPSDGIPTDGFPSDGLPGDDGGLPGGGNPGDGTLTDGNPSDGIPTDGLPGDGLPGDDGGLPSGGNPGDGTLTDGNPSDGIPTDGLPGDGLPGDDGGLPSGGGPGDGTPTDGNPSDGLPSDGLPGDGLPGDDGGLPGGGGPGDGNPNGGNPGDGNGDGDGGGTGNGNGTPGDGSGDDGSNSGGGGNGNGDGDGADGSGGNGSGGTGDGNGDGGNGAGNGGIGDGSGDDGSNSGGGGNGNGDGSGGDGSGGNGSGGTGDGNGDGGNGASNGGIGDGDGDGDGDGENGNGSGGNGDGNGDSGSGSGNGGNGDGSGDDGNGNGSGGNGDGNGDSGSGSGNGGNGDGSGNGGNGGNGSGGTGDGSGDDDQSDAASATGAPSFDISCDDAADMGKRKKERTDQSDKKKLIDVKQDGVKLRDPCQQPQKGDNRK